MYVVTAPHPVTIAGGLMVGPGETLEQLDLADPHNAELVEIGHVTILADTDPHEDLKGLLRPALEEIAEDLGIDDVKSITPVDKLKDAIRDARENPITPETESPDQEVSQ